jgi:hypothetical protein
VNGGVIHPAHGGQVQLAQQQAAAGQNPDLARLLAAQVPLSGGRVCARASVAGGWAEKF